MDTSQVLTSLRDKIILTGVLVIALLALVLIGMAMLKAEPNVPLIMALLALISSIIVGLFGIYKGTPSPPTESKTTETTTSSTSIPTTEVPNGKQKEEQEKGTAE
jgi:hypothetical protein